MADVDTAGRRRGRDERLQLRSKLWRLSSLPSVQACGRSLIPQGDGYVSVQVAQGVAGVSGLLTCSSVSACPCCSARIRESRARTIEAAGVAHLRAGGRLVWVTLTLPHDTGDDLADLLDTVLGGWSHLLMQRDWRALGERFGIDHGKGRRRVGYVRSLEVTHGRSGWHPHVHALLFLDGSAGRHAAAALADCLRSTWQEYVVARGWRLPEQLDVQAIGGRTGHAGLLRYLSKVQDQWAEPSDSRWSLGREMARGDRKRGRRWHTRLPFQLAASAAEGSARDLLLWHEYERATKGRRVIQPSQGLFRALGVKEVADELAPEVVEGVEVAQVEPADWKLVVRFRAVVRLYRAAERGGGPAVYDLLDSLRAWDRAWTLAREREAQARPIPEMSLRDVLAGYRRAAAAA
jgi:hypothetical protein